MGNNNINYHDKAMSQSQVINFRNRPHKLPKETDLQLIKIEATN